MLNGILQKYFHYNNYLSHTIITHCGVWQYWKSTSRRHDLIHLNRRNHVGLVVDERQEEAILVRSVVVLFVDNDKTTKDDDGL